MSVDWKICIFVLSLSNTVASPHSLPSHSLPLLFLHIVGFILPPLLFQTVLGWSAPNRGIGLTFRLMITLLGAVLLVSSTTFTIIALVKPDKS